jgi:biopolymer transport protein ExbD
MKLKSRSKITATFEMSSMTDLVFLLLIFFMLITTLVVPNVNTLKLSLPKSDEAKQTPPPAVSVAINKELQYFVNNQPVAADGLLQAIEAASVTVKDRTLILHTDNTVPVENVVRVMDIANRLRIKMVLATYPEK